MQTTANLTANDLVVLYNPEIAEHLPFMLLCDKLVRMTYMMLHEKCTGADYYVTLDQEGQYHLLRSVYEPDSDGSYYHNGFVDALKYDFIDDYEVIIPSTWNAMDIFNFLIKLQ